MKKIFDNIGIALDKTEDKISKIKDKAFEYVPEIDIDKLEENLENIGFKIPRVEIALTIPPRIAFEIDLEKSIIDKVKEQEFLDKQIDLENNDITERATIKVIQGLNQALKLRNKLKFKNKTLSRIQVEGSLIPTVKMIYLSKEEKLIEYKKDLA